MKIVDLDKAKNDSGGKAYGLYMLIKSNINVPKGFVLQNSQTFSSSDIIRIEQKLKGLNEKSKLAIRSSASDEDGSIQSYAGIFETVLNVDNNIDEVIKAIKTVNDSVKSNVANNYSNKKRKMNIIIQEMIEPRISGVCFTNSIDVDGFECALFEYVEGVGEKLVSGKANSNRIVIKYKNGKLNLGNITLNGKLTNFEGFNELCTLIQKAIDKYDKNLDIEWCIDNKGTAFLLQARPITKEVFVQINNNENTNIIVASRGFVEAETHVINSNEDFEIVQKEIDNFPENKILVCDYTETYYLPAMKKAKGIITNTGSFLCHAAIVSRELNIPCIVGYEGATDLFPSGTKIKLDANNNKISLIDKELEISNEYKMNFGELDCFDNYFTLNINNTKIFIEFTLNGIYVQKLDSVGNDVINVIEKFIRVNFNQIPKFSTDENKYLWIKEVERFRKLPFFEKYLDKIKKCSKIFDVNELKKIQEELINITKKVINYKKKSNDKILKLFIDEIIASINELLDGIIPFGYPMYESYVQSLNLLKEENKEFNDLFKQTEFNSVKLEQIKNFLNTVSNIKDKSYQIIWDLGGTDPDYFEKRDAIIEVLLKDNGIKIDDEILNVFYDEYLSHYYDKLARIIDNYDI